MTKLKKLNRRGFLMGLLSLSYCIIISNPVISRPDRSNSSSLISQVDALIFELLQAISGRPEMSEINYQLYETERPKSNDGKASYQHLIHDLASSTDNQGCNSRKSLRRKIDSIIRDNYKKGEIVEIGGWLVSRTEAAIIERAKYLS